VVSKLQMFLKSSLLRKTISQNRRTSVLIQKFNKGNGNIFYGAEICDLLKVWIQFKKKTLDLSSTKSNYVPLKPP